ncbi:MAG: YcaQ family DNA glycosylase [Maritimibacter sp.]|nr:YcaQ family DNA glycosylase [Maritimibacter sp.]
MSILRLSNRDARRLWLAQTLLTTGPKDPLEIIRGLGFLQIDTIRNAVRAQDHILWSRAGARYREDGVWKHLKSRALFEHFTHDASLIPAEVLPDWGRRFRVLGERTARSDWYRSGLGQAELKAIRDRIAAEGPLSTHAFDTKHEGPKEMWARPPHKKALDQMWYAGELATAHREKFVKFYDLGERVFPGGCPGKDHGGKPERDQVDALHARAMRHLGFATPSELMKFWGATSPAEVRDWTQRADLRPVEIEAADGRVYAALACPDIADRLAGAPEPGARVRLVNPFDPAVRERNRLERLFGFAYRNEMFVPKAQRLYGYYVYPLLEGLRFIGRVELKAERADGVLRVSGYWPEPGLRPSRARAERIAAELDRFRRFASLESVAWDEACPRP